VLSRHPLQSFLMVLGITLGVAVAVAVDLANTSASRAFELSTQAVAGRSTHYISGGPTGLDESLYVRLSRASLSVPVTPVISEYVSSPQLGNTLFQLLGIDVFTDGPFRGYLSNSESATESPAALSFVDFLTRPGAVILSEDLANRFGLEIGNEFELEIAGQKKAVFLAGLVAPSDELSRRALADMILADIATAQELTGRIGKLDRIELILEGNDQDNLLTRIQALLPPGLSVQPGEARSGTFQQMASAFQVNLTALSLLALVVGIFLIYNTMTFSVVQRRILFGTLRSIGVTRQEIFWMVVIEAALVGILGALLGTLLGILMGQGAVRLVTRTINDLFFVLNVQGVQAPASSLIKGALLGILAAVLSSAPPAWEAASVPPRVAMSRSGLEGKARSAVFLAAAGGAFLVAVGCLILFFSEKNLWLSFAGTSAVIIGCAMLAPIATLLFAGVIRPVAGWAWGALGRMATRDVVKSLSRTSIAVAALMVAVSVTIGVSIMVESFRHTVKVWLDQVLQGDIYISAPSLTATQASASLDPRLMSILESTQGIDAIYTLRSVNVESPQGLINIAASSNPQVGLERLYQRLSVPAEQVEEEMRKGAVVVSEVLANRLDLPPRGSALSLLTAQGMKTFPVIGVYYDYASTQGTVLMNQDVYRQYWEDDDITAIALQLSDKNQADAIAIELQSSLSSVQRLNVRPNRALKEEVMIVFDRTFAITGALQILATVVAFIGILSALLSLELERQRELGILRAVGMTTRQIWGLVLLETGILGASAGLLAMPTGFILAEILVYIINKRSFGWTLQLQVDVLPFLQALALALVAALLAGIYPSWRMGKLVAAEAMRLD